MPNIPGNNIIVGTAAAVIVAIGSAIIFFDTDNKGPNSGDEIDVNQEQIVNDSDGDVDSDEPTSPDSGDEIDTSEPANPDDDTDSDEPSSPDSGDDIDTTEPTSPDSGDEIDPNAPTSPDSGDDISLSDDLKNKAKGSCNLISEGSTCVEYIGSYRTAKTAKLNCSDYNKFTTKPCPRPALGGCHIGDGSSNEIVT
ncbi:hypothetical protein EOM39_02520 [Candidatus Gracilibacteria bacterium]|nr:hypothetical protein [Candidatus Gracilibacteria bacterium]